MSSAQDSNILVFGGTFDPPHIAHVQLPAIVAEKLGCDRVLYVPARQNPLKSEAPLSSDKDRLAMLGLAIRDVPGAAISTVELERPGPSYMVDTLHELQQQAGERPIRWRLLIGADQAVDFHRWRDWKRILALATPAVMLRAPLTRESLRSRLDQVYDGALIEQWMKWIVDVPAIDVSSTELRRRIAAGDVPDDWLDPRVADYIQTNGLYR